MKKWIFVAKASAASIAAGAALLFESTFDSLKNSASRKKTAEKQLFAPERPK